MKAVMLSIRPEWCEKIASGKKTIEVRKTKPKLDTSFKCYIYATKSGSRLVINGDKVFELSKDIVGKVIGEFVCDAILPISVSYSDPNNRIALREFPFTCLTDKQIMDYLGNGKTGYGWHISDLVIYDTPKAVYEFFVKCNENCEDCDWWARVKVNADEFDMDCTSPLYGYKPLKHPPQSWCYVED